MNRKRWIVIVVCACVVEALYLCFRAAYPTVIGPMLESQRHHAHKQATVREMQLLINCIKQYQKDNGRLPNDLSNLGKFYEKVSAARREAGRPFPQLYSDFVYVVPPHVEFDTPILFEKMGHYPSRPGAHIGEWTGAVRWFGEESLRSYLAKRMIPEAISNRICQAKQ